KALDGSSAMVDEPRMSRGGPSLGRWRWNKILEMAPRRLSRHLAHQAHGRDSSGELHPRHAPLHLERRQISLTRVAQPRRLERVSFQRQLELLLGNGRGVKPHNNAAPVRGGLHRGHAYALIAAPDPRVMVSRQWPQVQGGFMTLGRV